MSCTLHEEQYVEFEISTYHGWGATGAIKFVSITPKDGTIKAAEIEYKGLFAPSLEEKRAALSIRDVEVESRNKAIEIAGRIISDGGAIKDRLDDESKEQGQAVHPQFLTLRILHEDGLVVEWEGPIGIAPKEGLIGEVYSQVNKLASGK